jgi:DNA-binding LytR/AlgR family response regulator
MYLMHSNQKRLVSIKTYLNLKLIDISNILCCTSAGRTADIILTSGKSIQTMHSLKELEEKLKHGRFLRCHAKYLINLEHPLTYDSQNREIELSNKMKLSVAKDRKALVTKILNNSIF